MSAPADDPPDAVLTPGLYTCAKLAYEAYWANFRGGGVTPFAKLTDEGRNKWKDVATAVIAEERRASSLGRAPSRTPVGAPFTLKRRIPRVR